MFKEDVYFNDGDALYLDYEMKITEGEVLDTYHHTSKGKNVGKYNNFHVFKLRYLTFIWILFTTSKT